MKKLFFFQKNSTQPHNALIQDLAWDLIPRMSFSPGPVLESSSPTLHQDLVSCKANCEDLPHVYTSPLGMDNHTICIPSPYVDTSQGYSPPHAGEYNHRALSVYSPVSSTVLGYSRPPVSDSLVPLAPTVFWPPRTTHTPLSLHCPPPLAYSETHTRGSWEEGKTHGFNQNR